MHIPIYQLDAFAERLFEGNPAAVCLLSQPLAEATMQAIAAENNLAETAFVIDDNPVPRIRWFTPTREVHLCGHATLAAAHVWLDATTTNPPPSRATFESMSGRLHVDREPDGRLTLDFPVRPCDRAVAPPVLLRALNIDAVETAVGDDWLVRLADEAAVRAIEPDLAELRALDRRGVIVTAEGEHCDFVSRFFAPQYGIDEDPVTGSAHCMLAPFWEQRVGRDTLTARQVSARGGGLSCRLIEDRVRLTGGVVPYMTGSIELG